VAEQNRTCISTRVGCSDMFTVDVSLAHAGGPPPRTARSRAGYGRGLVRGERRQEARWRVRALRVGLCGELRPDRLHTRKAELIEQQFERFRSLSRDDT
jgi:hypothetical protein